MFLPLGCCTAAAVGCNPYVAVGAIWPMLQTENQHLSEPGILAAPLLSSQCRDARMSSAPVLLSYPALGFSFSSLGPTPSKMARSKGRVRHRGEGGAKKLSLARGPSSVSDVASTVALSELKVARGLAQPGRNLRGKLRVSSNDIVILTSAGSDETDL